MPRQLFLTVAFLLAAVAAHGQTAEQLRAHCSTPAGRDSLINLMDPMSRSDVESQADGQGLPRGPYMQTHMVQICAAVVGPISDTPTPQIWAFQFDGRVPPGHSFSFFVQDLGRCGEYCHATQTFEYPRYEVCRFSYRTELRSSGPWRGERFSPQLDVQPSLWEDGSDPYAFRGITIAADAGRGAAIEIHDMAITVIDVDEDRNRFDCMKIPRGTVYTSGRSECVEDRSGLRHSDRCNFTYRAVGSRISLHRSTMRKASIAVPSGSTSQFRVITRNYGSITRDFLLEPGKSVELLSKSGDYFTDYEVEITATKLGDDGKAHVAVSLEWFS